ncbi:MAG: 2OG-Fe(II) oxygenase family protein [Brevundimonas sp.]|uniref:2OG-Fe(II) oxygenase n=1 Tax=Brevundimonas sp. TaxID=1871086 RepID=UPI0027360570|nr:2OG-Fe(II) oxygenase family protein [Brevundimonas sp.]MDP3378687.1 2OG-Fe(II) oxygenase family protein [Brevundimonas sp.]
MTLTLAPDLDLTGAAERLAATGRARVPGLLGEGAETLHEALTGPDMVWNRAIQNPYNADVPVAVFEAEPLAEQARLYAMAHEEATEGFQFIFDRIKLGQARAMGLPLPPVLFELHDLFNSEAFLAMARRLTGDDRIAYVDAQPTRYLPGHFLNGHTDAHEDAGRLYAYVLNLSPRWRAEWGGLLMFLDGEGAVTETFTPAFGTLNLFKVPQDHAVSMVAPFAGAPRYSITGWWRTRPPGG